ncbi:MAG: UDP-N-acetylmuramoyl-tripeptide--D-alanyl-D-alanine ligase [Oscillospiraceae bacterium]|nr:UDP-N-acetylmuramoyl-tripeptide--D-alanyl-D-alanine ligase [Oscillospiraceae bacterium]
MENLKVSEIFDLFKMGIIFDKDIAINKISTDTREIEKGDIFIGIRGENFDGNFYIDDALLKGAILAIGDNYTGINESVIKVGDSRKAFLDISNYYRKKFDIPVIGITGSVGKTSTKDMIYSILSKKGLCLKTEGNLNNDIGVPKTLLNLSNSDRFAVVEMGMSNLGEISRLSKACKPNIGVITNIGMSHIENLKSVKNIQKAKLEILDGIDSDGILILNGDDKLLWNLEKTVNRQIIYFGIDNIDCDIIATNIISKSISTRFNIIDKKESIPFEIPCLGKHNIYNAIVGYIVGKQLGLSKQEIYLGIKTYISTGMRQKIDIISGITIINDCYNSSPESMVSAIDILNKIKSKKEKILVLGDMLELGDLSISEHIKLANIILSSDITRVFAIGNNTKYTIETLNNHINNSRESIFFEDSSSLIDKIKSSLSYGDLILFKASRGIKMEEIVKKIYEECL